MRHHYVGPRPITKGSFKNWLREGVQSGQIGHVHSSGMSHYKTGEPVPWVEDDKPESEDPPELPQPDLASN